MEVIKESNIIFFIFENGAMASASRLEQQVLISLLFGTSVQQSLHTLEGAAKFLLEVKNNNF